MRPGSLTEDVEDEKEEDSNNLGLTQQPSRTSKAVEKLTKETVAVEAMPDEETPPRTLDLDCTSGGGNNDAVVVVTADESPGTGWKTAGACGDLRRYSDDVDQSLWWWSSTANLVRDYLLFHRHKAKVFEVDDE